MARRLRFVPPGGAMVEVTCRTVQGRLLLRPSPVLTDLTLGVLGRAARLYRVDVHAFAFLSNHYHLLVTVAHAQQLASFMNFLNSNLAREAGRHVRWREKFWGRRYQAIVVSSEPDCQVERLAYLLAHGAKEGLVDSPCDWPGAHAVGLLLGGTPARGRWHDRTLEWKARRKSLPLDPNAFVEEETLELAPLPCWSTLAADTRRERIRQLVGEIEIAAKRRRAETGKPSLGREQVCRQNPHLEPNRIKKGRAPLVHALDAAVRRAFRSSYFAFLDAFLRAARRLRSGEFAATFPEGAFPPPLPFRFAAPPG